MRYNNIRLDEAIKNYIKGDKTLLENELMYLIRSDIPAFSREIFYFLNEVIEIAKQKKDKIIISKCQELSLKMEIYNGNNLAHSAVMENSIETTNDCLIALDECLMNGQYQSILTNIIMFIKKKCDFHIVKIVVDFLLKTPHMENEYYRERVVLYFLERVCDDIITDVCPIKTGKIIKKYKPSNNRWSFGFSSEEYIFVLDIMKKYDLLYKFHMVKDNSNANEFMIYSKMLEIRISEYRYKKEGEKYHYDFFITIKNESVDESNITLQIYDEDGFYVDYEILETVSELDNNYIVSVGNQEQRKVSFVVSKPKVNVLIKKLLPKTGKLKTIGGFICNMQNLTKNI